MQRLLAVIAVIAATSVAQETEAKRLAINLDSIGKITHTTSTNAAPPADQTAKSILAAFDVAT